MIKAFFLIFTLVTLSLAVTLEEINDKPSSRQKNFLIWQFLHQDINASEANQAFYQIENVSDRFLFDYAAKTDENEIKYTVDCLQKQLSNFALIEQDDCLMLALTPSKATGLNAQQRENIAQRLNNQFGNIQWLRVMNQDNFFVSDENLSDESFLFRTAGAAYRYTHFNHTLSPMLLEALSKSNAFSQIAFLSITDPKMDQIQRSLVDTPIVNYGAQTNFFLAINAIKYGNLLTAQEHLKMAKDKFVRTMDRDKVLFWLYQITKDSMYLEELSKSVDINMYVLYARELLNLPTENYFTTLPTRDNPQSIQAIDPFEWKSFSEDIVQATPESLVTLIDRCDGNESVGVQGFVLERMYEPYIHNFTMAYDQYMSSLTVDQKALMYALMRQETRFIPGLISRSFALGLMQIMPFNVDTISKTNVLKPNHYFDMLKPEYSISYAISHLKHLTDKYYNPILVAYGYNAGFGSTKRLLTDGSGRFLPGEYEPFISMELMGNDENREYGKKVLANYVVYKKILGEEIKITSLLNNLVQPDQSDYFRATALKLPPQESRSE